MSMSQKDFSASCALTETACAAGPGLPGRLRGCPGPRGPQGPAGPQPPLSDAVDSPAQDVAASSLAVRTLYMGTRRLLRENLTIHVRENGDDARDGLTEATAKASVQGALTWRPRSIRAVTWCLFK